jgi:hypothetical protein
MFWTGLLIGIFIGTFIGVWVACLCHMAVEDDRHILKGSSQDQESECLDPQS